MQDKKNNMGIFKNKKSINKEDRKFLETFEQRISLSIDSFLVLSEKGSPTQIALAHQKAKQDFFKYAPQMKRLADKLGGDFPAIVSDFLESVGNMLHSRLVSEDQISYCGLMKDRLKSELRV